MTEIIEAQVTYTAMMADTLLVIDRIKEKIERWYDMGLWNAQMVQNAVEKGLIYEQEYTEIVGDGE